MLTCVSGVSVGLTRTSKSAGASVESSSRTFVISFVSRFCEISSGVSVDSSHIIGFVGCSAGHEAAIFLLHSVHNG